MTEYDQAVGQLRLISAAIDQGELDGARTPLVFATVAVNAMQAEIARLRDALDGMVERCLDSGFPDEWIDDDSSMAMQVTMGGRELAAARAALAVAGGIA